MALVFALIFRSTQDSDTPVDRSTIMKNYSSSLRGQSGNILHIYVAPNVIHVMFTFFNNMNKSKTHLPCIVFSIKFFLYIHQGVFRNFFLIK